MELRFEHLVRAPPEGVFAFHEDPSSLVALHRGLPSFRHGPYEHPRRFCESQIRGPFRRF